MAKKFPLDEFDSVEAHGGRHRIRRTGFDRLREFFRYMLFSAIIAGAGFATLSWIDNSNVYSGDVPSVSNSVDPAKSYQVTVLDATGGDSAASALGRKILNAGYTSVTADVANSEAKSVVYYASGDAKATALALAKIAGNLPTKLSNRFTDPVTVVLGADYKK
jgi:hypothetical protein